jgi:hypothetical protein
MSRLHIAVHKTANKLLDTPEYRPLTDDPSPLESRLLAVLEPLGYSELRYANQYYYVHPLAYKYFKRYGEQYVQLLEATQRLTQ